MNAYRRYPVLAAITVFLTVMACTDNPFFEDKVSANNRSTVSGKVQLNDGTSPEDVYIWLAGMDVSARTDGNGNFTLVLPAPGLQPGGGITGVFKLYYYVGNYRFTTSSVLIRNGFFEYGSEDINAKGYISKTITLRKILDIQTSIDSTTFLLPDTLCHKIQVYVGDTLVWVDSCQIIPKDYDLKATITVTNLLPSVNIQSYKIDDHTAACLIFSKKGEPRYKSRFIFSRPYTGLTLEAIDHPVKWSVDIPWYYLPSESGLFYIRPFILVRQEGLPKGLTDSFGKHANIASGEYLYVPYKMHMDSVNFVTTNNR